jgi:hypothetical protein
VIIREIMSERAETFRRRAEDCERPALSVSDPEVQASYWDMARQWRVMADLADAANKGTLASLPKPSELASLPKPWE